MAPRYNQSGGKPMGHLFDRIMDVLQLIVLIGSVWTLAKTAVKVAKAPEKSQNDRIRSLEVRVDKISERLEDGDRHFAMIDDGTVITQQFILVMMDALINGDNTTELKAKRDLMQTYLLQRGIK